MRRARRPLRSLVAGLAAVGVLTCASAGRAQSQQDVVLISASSALTLSAAALGITNAVYLGRDARPPVGALAFGYVCGLTSLVFGTAMVATVGDDILGLSLGLAGIGVGAAAIGLTLWAHLNRPRARVAMPTPIFGVDRDGRIFSGLGLVWTGG